MLLALVFMSVCEWYCDSHDNPLTLGFLGTGATNPASFCNAIKDARSVFLQAERLGFHPKILDIGGGFQDDCFESMAPVIRDAIRSEFPTNTTVIAEPGRFYARSVYTLVCRVISRRRQLGSAAASGIPDMLYQNDGIYGNFMNVIMEKEIMVPHLLRSKKSKTELSSKYRTDVSEKGNEATSPSASHRYSIWGPTCDSTDCVVREVSLDSEVKIGDWFKYKNMGGECCQGLQSHSGTKLILRHPQLTRVPPPPNSMA